MPDGITLMAMFGGFAGSFHCIGMCGGFVCGLSRAGNANRRQMVLKNLLYNAGRLTTYTFIGAIVALGSSALIDSGNPSAEYSMPGVQQHSSEVFSGLFLGQANVWQQLLSIAAGIMMFFMAIQLLGIRRHVRPSWGRLGGATLAAMLQTLVRSNRPAASVALGVVNGFLPCPLVLSFAAVAAASGSVACGMLIMFAFGLGTFPAMLFMGTAGGLISTTIRQRGVRASGMLLVLFSVFTIARGIVPMSWHGHHNMNAMHNASERVG